MRNAFKQMLQGILCLLVSMGIACADEGASPATETDAATPAQEATLIVLNISGPTLFGSNQEITDNGKDLVSLPRNTNKQLTIAGGAHEFRFKPFPEGRRVARLDAEAGKTYYLVVGYSPAKSWAFPFAGDPMLIKMIGEEEATALLREMQAQ